MKLKELLDILHWTVVLEIYEEDGKRRECVGYGKLVGKNHLTEIGKKYLENEIVSVDIDSDLVDIWLKVVVKKIPFNELEWIERMVDEYYSDFDTISCNGDDTIFVLNPEQPKKYGWSKCNRDKDEYNSRKGVAIAYARYKGYEIPEEL